VASSSKEDRGEPSRREASQHAVNDGGVRRESSHASSRVGAEAGMAPASDASARDDASPDNGASEHSGGEERISKAQLDREFSELYTAHLRDVYSYAYYRVGNHHDAEDLTEQTFLQAYRHFERARRESNGRPLRPWLIRIAHNLAANLYRDRSRKPASPIEDTASLSTQRTTEEIVEGREELMQVLDGIAKLPDDRREALIMRFALDMDNREIARTLGRSEGATKVLIHRAIRQLEGILKAERAD
jgi:RNA polymerase sigma-70 factor, ECF subfamily